MSRILLVSGELSGDLYQAALSRELKRQNQKLEIVGVGGDPIASVVDTHIVNTTGNSAIGLKGAIFQRSFFKKIEAGIMAYAKENKVDKAIIIDFQHHNFALAKLLQNLNIPIYTFITPNFWLWKDKKQGQKLADYSRKVITITNREYEFYKSITDRVVYLGHPLFSMLDLKSGHPTF